MSLEIPSLKAKPETIPKVLQIIKNNEGSFKKMEDAIVNYWRDISLRIKLPSTKNSLRAVYGPTLRHLQLIRGEGDNIKLLPKGKELLRAYETRGESAFKKAFAKHLLRLDMSSWANLIFELHRLNEAHVSDILKHLLKKYPTSTITFDRLKKFLLYLSYVGLVSFNDQRVKLLKSQVDICLQGLEIRLSKKKFTHILIEKYKELKDVIGSPYVPIPELKDKVSEEMPGAWYEFDDLLKSIPKETPRYLIHLSQPMLRKSGGIKIGDKYFYYVAIIQK